MIFQILTKLHVSSVMVGSLFCYTVHALYQKSLLSLFDHVLALLACHKPTICLELPYDEVFLYKTNRKPGFDPALI